ncbi:MAG: alginate O-acetyltransferase AlgX-related protein [Limisphaerales bacterium]
MRSAAAKGLLLTVALFTCLALLELAVRQLFPYFSPSAQIPFRLAAKGMALGPAGQTVRMATPKGDYNSVLRFNEAGFRDKKELQEATAADWFALGDSYTLGWGVEEEERFSNRLEQEFKANGINARVFNIAIPDNIIGYGRLLHYAESRGAKVSRLIVGLCMENDLRDYRDGKGAWDLIDLPTSSKKEAAREWLKKHSALYIAASYELQRFPLTRGLMHRIGIARSIDELTGHNEWDETVLKTSRDELTKLVTGREALILIIPSRNLWYGDYIQTERRIHETFVRMLREAGLNVVDLKPSLEATGDPLSCYFKSDPHWDARGHAVAGRELFRVIQERSQK